MFKYLVMSDEGEGIYTVEHAIGYEELPLNHYDITDNIAALIDLVGGDLDRLYIKDGIIYERQARPSFYHKWSMVTEKWEEELARKQKDCIEELNSKIDALRGVYVTKGDYILQEYTLAKNAAQSYVDTGLINTIVDTWAGIQGISANDAAEEILTKSQQFEAMMGLTRELRLKSRERINNARTLAEVDLVMVDSLAKLQTIGS